MKAFCRVIGGGDGGGDAGGDGGGGGGDGGGDGSVNFLEEFGLSSSSRFLLFDNMLFT